MDHGNFPEKQSEFSAELTFQ